MNDETKNRLVKKREAAALLSCSTRMIERLVSAGKLTRVKVLGAVRFRLSEVLAIVEGKTV